MRPTILLFDIDGTLVTTGGVGRRALEKTFERVYSRADAFAGVHFDGMTDRAIIRAGLAALPFGSQPDNETIDSLLKLYLCVLAEEVAAADTARYRVHTGMREAVLSARVRGMAVGLGTGNVREGARLKLSRVGLYEQFGFGGFGCDHEDRAELLRIGAARGAASLGRPLTSCRVVVIGDTPKDVAAAKGIGAECVGVGTGSFSPENLVAAGATWAFPTLASPGALEALFSG
ncbi:MAG: HAD family hydrolase [Myxococcota bacterium]